MKTADITADSSYLNNDVFASDTLGDYFTTGGTYNGKSQKPTITLAGAKALWGLEPSDPNDEEAVKTFLDSLYGTKYTVTWQAGRYFDKNPDDQTPASEIPADKQGDYKEIVAGSHYYRIVDTTTGSVICYKHLYSIDRSPFTLAAIDPQVGFVGETPSYTIKVMGTKTDGKATDYYTYTKDFDNGLIYEKSTSTTMHQLQEQPGDAIDDSVEINDSIANNNHYLPPSLTYTLKCYVLPTTYTTANTKTYFGSIVDAINDDSTVSGVTIVPMQQVSYNAGKLSDGKTDLKGDIAVTDGRYSHVIDGECTIKSGVTLLIPYDVDMKYYDASTKTYTPQLVNTTPSKSAYTQTSYLKNYVTVNGTLNNQGTIIIPGVVTGGGGGHISSFTSAEHSRIKLGANAVINNTGNIRCHGYIDETSNKNGSQVITSAGQIEVIFSIVEHHGGSNFFKMYMNGAIGKCTPFNRFYVESITSELIVQEGASVVGFYDIYISGHINDTIGIFGLSSSSFVQFGTNTKKTEVSFRYDTAKNQNIMVVYGDASLNKLDVKVKYGVTITISTQDVYMPLSHYWNIRLSKYDQTLNSNLSGTQLNATVEALNQDIKIMPGATFVIDEGVTLKGRELAVYDTSISIPSATGFDYYAKAFEDADSTFDATKAATYDDGKLIVNGTLEVTHLGGYIQTKNAGATVKISTATQALTGELTADNGYGGDTYITATGKVSENGSVGTKTLLTVNELVNANGVSSENAYYKACDTDAWSYLRSITISYNVNGSTVAPVTGIAPKSETLWSNVGITLSGDYVPTTLTRDYYTFNQWTIASNGSAASGKTVYSNTTLNANWNAITYKITFNYPDSAAAGFALPTMDPFTVEDLTEGKLTLTKPEPVGIYSFNGWYSASNFLSDYRIKYETMSDDGYVVSLSVLAKLGAYDSSANTRSIQLYGQWSNIVHTIKYDLTNSYGYNVSLDEVNLSPSNISDPISYLMEDATRVYYIDYWTCEGVDNPIYPYDNYWFVDADATEGKTYTLKAHWKAKEYSIVITDNYTPNVTGKDIEFTQTLYFTEAQIKAGLNISDIAELKAHEATAKTYNNDPAVNNYFVSGWKLGTSLITQIVTTTFNDVTADANGVKTITLTPDWKTKTKITFNGYYNNAQNNTIYTDKVTYGDLWYIPGTNMTLPDVTAYNNTVGTNDNGQKYYFDSWSLGDNYSAGGNYLVPDNDVIINIYWKFKIEVEFDPTAANDYVLGISAVTVWLSPGAYDISNISNFSDIYDGLHGGDYNPKNKWYYNGILKCNGTEMEKDDTTIIVSEDASKYTITVKWEEKKSITFTGNADAIDTIKVTSSNHTEGNLANDGAKLWYIAGTKVTFELDWASLKKNEKFYIGDGDTPQTLSNNKVEYTISDNVTVRATAENESCFVEGTLITLADGTQKRIEDITTDDVLLVFNHVTGKLEAQKLFFTAHKDQSAMLHRVLTLEFSNGESVRIAANHGFFDLTLNKYVYIDGYNVSEYIGHKFYSARYVDGKLVEEEVTLVNSFVTEEFVKVYSPVSEYTFNCFAENILSITPFYIYFDGFANVFEYGEGMKYDEEKMLEDIEKYGLYTYEEFAEYYTYEQFMATGTPYFKVAVGKGYITYDEILDIIRYLKSEGLS